jgi:LmbE family N-acetylglucosaminyl deacetylase
VIDARAGCLEPPAYDVARREERGVLDDGAVDRVLVVTAHPDDVDFGAAGTVATWTASGTEVTYCVCTDGDAGGFDPTVDRADIPGIRRAEQEAAAKAVGVHDVRFLGYRDGALEPTMDLRRDISRVIRQVRPERMLIQSPERNWERIQASHPDHLAAGEAAIAAIYPDARNPFAHPELLRDDGLADWAVAETWLMAHPTTNHHVDITGVFDAKLAALRAHVSQTAHMDGFEDRMREWFGLHATAAGLPEGRLAERFHVVPTA